MPRTIIIEKQVYTVDELTEQALKQAYDNWTSISSYFYEDYVAYSLTALEKFEEVAGITATNYEYDAYSGYISFRWANGKEEFLDMAYTENAHMTGVRLATYLYNNFKDVLYTKKFYGNPGARVTRKSKFQVEELNCGLTGYYIDFDLLKPISDFIKNPSNLSYADVMQKCLDSWIEASKRAYAGYYSVENFKEHCKANEWEFNADGSIFIGA